MKLFAYVGSYRDENSFCKMTTELLFEKLCNYSDCEMEMFTPNEYKIHECTGCCSCFISGVCTQKDDFLKVLNAMTASDIILFAVPIYFHSISGNSKTFIDRLSYLSHLMYFMGKLGIVIVCTDNNGAEKAVEYLKEVQAYLGLNTVLSFVVYTNNCTKKTLESVVEYQIKNLAYSLSETYIPSELQDYYFEMQNNNFQKKHDHEETVWKSRGFEKYKSFKEAYENNASQEMIQWKKLFLQDYFDAIQII